MLLFSSSVTMTSPVSSAAVSVSTLPLLMCRLPSVILDLSTCCNSLHCDPQPFLLKMEGDSPGTSGSKRRRRFDEDEDGSQRLAAVLASYLSFPGKVQYGEVLGKARLDKKALLQHAGLLWELKKLQDNLVFAQSTMTTALKQVADTRSTVWKLSDDDKEDWTSRMSKRLRCMCTHFSSACRKTRQPKWMNQLMAIKGSGLSKGPVHEDDGHDVVEISPEIPRFSQEESETFDDSECEQESFYLGWDPEVNRAWRVHVEDKSKKQEYTENITIMKDAKDTDEVTATWPDGYYGIVPGLTVGQWKARVEAIKNKKGNKMAAEWTSKEHFIRIKKDRRGPLAWLGHVSNKSKQVCQLPLDKCPSKDFAVQLLAKVAEKLENGSKDPYHERNTLLEENGISASKKPKVKQAENKRKTSTPEVEEEEE